MQRCRWRSPRARVSESSIGSSSSRTHASAARRRRRSELHASWPCARRDSAPRSATSEQLRASSAPSSVTSTTRARFREPPTRAARGARPPAGAEQGSSRGAGGRRGSSGAPSCLTHQPADSAQRSFDGCRTRCSKRGADAHVLHTLTFTGASAPDHLEFTVCAPRVPASAFSCSLAHASVNARQAGLQVATYRAAIPCQGEICGRNLQISMRRLNCENLTIRAYFA